MSAKLFLSPGHLDPGGDGDADQGQVTLPPQGCKVKLSLACGLEAGVSQHLPRDLNIDLGQKHYCVQTSLCGQHSHRGSQWGRWGSCTAGQAGWGPCCCRRGWLPCSRHTPPRRTPPAAAQSGLPPPAETNEEMSNTPCFLKPLVESFPASLFPIQYRIRKTSVSVGGRNKNIFKSMSLLGNSSADANDVFLSFLFLPQPINSILLITYNDITITHRPHEILRQCDVRGRMWDWLIYFSRLGFGVLGNVITKRKQTKNCQSHFQQWSAHSEQYGVLILYDCIMLLQCNIAQMILISKHPNTFPWAWFLSPAKGRLSPLDGRVPLIQISTCFPWKYHIVNICQALVQVRVQALVQRGPQVE